MIKTTMTNPKNTSPDSGTFANHITYPIKEEIASLRTNNQQQNPSQPHTTNTSSLGVSSLQMIGNKFNGQNNVQRAQSMEIFIGGRGKEELLTNEHAAPLKEDPSYST